MTNGNKAVLDIIVKVAITILGIIVPAFVCFVYASIEERMDQNQEQISTMQCTMNQQFKEITTLMGAGILIDSLQGRDIQTNKIMLQNHCNDGRLHNE